MKKCLILLAFSFIPFWILAQTELRRQPFWGASFIPNGQAFAGATVRRIEAGAPAALAGLQDGDIIIRMNGVLLSDPYIHGKTFRSVRAGDQVKLDILRNENLRGTHHRSDRTTF